MSNKKNKILKYQEREYFCSNCKRYHKKGTHNYSLHYEQKANLTKSQIFREMFKQKYKNIKSDTVEANQKIRWIN
ncbi:MAG: hypothetical protein ACFFAO_02130 [Candidatus Hermodarchaeota archaeon]